jgi:hypothetical protein
MQKIRCQYGAVLPRRPQHFIVRCRQIIDLGSQSPEPAIVGFAVPGLLSDQAQQGGVDFQEGMRRRRAALKVGPVVYDDEERTF